MHVHPFHTLPHVYNALQSRLCTPMLRCQNKKIFFVCGNSGCVALVCRQAAFKDVAKYGRKHFFRGAQAYYDYDSTFAYVTTNATAHARHATPVVLSTTPTQGPAVELLNV